jgi:hypothetical protein
MSLLLTFPHDLKPFLLPKKEEERRHQNRPKKRKILKKQLTLRSYFDLPSRKEGKEKKNNSNGSFKSGAVIAMVLNSVTQIHS